MGYRGKVDERARARKLRALSWTLADIAGELGVAKSSVSTWVRDVEFVPKPRNRGNGVTKPHPAHLRRLDVGIRHNKHQHGCFTARYASARLLRAALGLCRGLVHSRGSARDPG